MDSERLVHQFHDALVSFAERRGIKMKISEMKQGQKKEIVLNITRQDVNRFAEISGDFSPIHMDEDYAQNTKFGKCLVHGMYIGAIISRIIGMELPGKGTIYVSQNMQFKRPIFIGSRVTVGVEVKEIFEEKNRVLLQTYCLNEENKILIEGEAVVMPPR